MDSLDQMQLYRSRAVKVKVQDKVYLKSCIKKTKSLDDRDCLLVLYIDSGKIMLATTQKTMGFPVLGKVHPEFAAEDMIEFRKIKRISSFPQSPITMLLTFETLLKTEQQESKFQFQNAEVRQTWQSVLMSFGLCQDIDKAYQNTINKFAQKGKADDSWEIMQEQLGEDEDDIQIQVHRSSRSQSQMDQSVVKRNNSKCSDQEPRKQMNYFNFQKNTTIDIHQLYNKVDKLWFQSFQRKQQISEIIQGQKKLQKQIHKISNQKQNHYKIQQEK